MSVLTCPLTVSLGSCPSSASSGPIGSILSSVICAPRCLTQIWGPGAPGPVPSEAPAAVRARVPRDHESHHGVARFCHISVLSESHQAKR